MGMYSHFQPKSPPTSSPSVPCSAFPLVVGGFFPCHSLMAQGNLPSQGVFFKTSLPGGVSCFVTPLLHPEILFSFIPMFPYITNGSGIVPLRYGFGLFFLALVCKELQRAILTSDSLWDLLGDI